MIPRRLPSGLQGRPSAPSTGVIRNPVPAGQNGGRFFFKTNGDGAEGQAYRGGAARTPTCGGGPGSCPGGISFLIGLRGGPGAGPRTSEAGGCRFRRARSLGVTDDGRDQTAEDARPGPADVVRPPPARTVRAVPGLRTGGPGRLAQGPSAQALGRVTRGGNWSYGQRTPVRRTGTGMRRSAGTTAWGSARPESSRAPGPVWQ